MSDDDRKDTRASQFKTVFRPSPLQDGDGEQAPLFGNLANPDAGAPKAPPPIPTAPPASSVAPIYEMPAGQASSGGGSVFPWILSALLLIALGFMVVRYVVLAPSASESEAVAPAAPAMGAQAQRLSDFLATEIGDGRLAVEEDDATVRVVTKADALFKGGSSEFSPGSRELFDRIGKALEQENAKFITVESFSAGGAALAQSRAEAAAEDLKKAISDNRRIKAEGKVEDAEPNGRIEVVIDRKSDGAGQ